MSASYIWEQLGNIHEQIRKKVEQHFNEGQDHHKYAVCNLTCNSETAYTALYGGKKYHAMFTLARFDVCLADTDVDGSASAISCVVKAQNTGEITIEDVRYSNRIALKE